MSCNINTGTVNRDPINSQKSQKGVISHLQPFWQAIAVHPVNEILNPVARFKKALYCEIFKLTL